MSDFLVKLLIDFPIFVVCLFLLVAAIMQTRSEKGGILIIVGAAIMVLHRLIQFVHSTFLAGQLWDLMYETGMESDARSLILNLVWAGIQSLLFIGLLLVAIGIFLRPASSTGVERPG